MNQDQSHELFETIAKLEYLRNTLDQAQTLLDITYGEYFTHTPKQETCDEPYFQNRFHKCSLLLTLTDELLIDVRTKLDEAISEQLRIYRKSS